MLACVFLFPTYIPQWKSDYTIASVVLSERLGRLAAELAGWTGTRVGQDDIWWKPPGTKAVSFHQDAPYFDFLNPVHTHPLRRVALLRSYS
jgi:hypothetical protein